MPDFESSDPLLTVKGLAAREGVPQDTIRNLIRTSDLPHYRVNGIKIRLSEYRTWMEGHKKGAHVDVPTLQSQAQTTLALAQRMAPLLREQGIVDITIPGLSFSMLPPERKQPEVSSDNDQTEARADPLQDAATFGRADGSMPGFAKLRDKSAQ